MKNETFNNKIFKNDKLSLSYIITYSAHMPFKTNKGTCQKLTNETGLTEFECLKLQAKETDDMIKLLFENSIKKVMSQNITFFLYMCCQYQLF